MLFRHSIKAKTLSVIAAVFLLQAIFSARSIFNTYEEYRRMRLIQVSQAFELQGQILNKQILLLQKSVQQLALQGEMYLTLPTHWRPSREAVARRVLAETPQAVGGGMWFEPYLDDPKKLRSCVYLSREKGALALDPVYEGAGYDYHNQMWYTVIKERARQSLEVVWTPPYRDTNSNGQLLMTTLGCNLYFQEDLVGMVTLDWELSDIGQRVSALLPTTGSVALFADLLNDAVLFNTSEEGGGLGTSVWALPWMRYVGGGQSRFSMNGVEHITLMQTMDNGMALVLVVPEDELYGPVRRSLYGMLNWQAVFSLLLLGVTWYLLQRFISKPVQRITDKAVMIGAGDLNVRIPVTDKGELGMLGTMLNTMTENLQKHMTAMHRLTQEKERIAAELDVATRIQTAMMPCIFPPFPDRNEFGLYAFMRPAREVGGDFYDFFLVDDQHLALVIADVSGKGVPAALFMVIAKTLLKNHLQAGLSPCQALAAANNQLCENNSMNMFVTVWVGLLTLKNGHLRYSNAGHNKPLYMDANCSAQAYTCLGSKRGFVLGGMMDSSYADEHCTLGRGDRIVLYTDGITEAETSDSEQFGLQRLRHCADESLALPLEKAVQFVTTSVDDFAGNAPQADDMTLLLLEYDGLSEQENACGPLETWKSRVPADISHYPVLSQHLEATLARHHCPGKATHHLLLALEEAFVNIAHYAYPEGTGEAMVECRIEPCCDESCAAEGQNIKAVLCFRDRGKAFNPLEQPEPDTSLVLSERMPGGLGIHILHKMMDTLEYQRQDGENILTLTKRWHIPAETPLRHS